MDHPGTTATPPRWRLRGLVEGRPHPRLDRIVRLARQVVDVPLAAVTVLEEDRAWFPSLQQGPVGCAPEPGPAAPPLPRRDTFCSTTQLLDRTLVVEDALADPRFADLPIVRDDGVRFYAGRPLRDPGGSVVATLCVFDVRRRALTLEQADALEDLGAWAEQELAGDAEMRLAGEAQAQLLPRRPLRIAGYAVQGRCRPALAVGGDFFDHGEQGGTVHLALADVMGKGTPAALVGAGVRAALRTTHAALAAGVDLGVLVTRTARALEEDLDRTGAFVTLLQVAVDRADGHLRWVDAGSGLGLLVRADGTHRRLTGGDRPLGVLPDDHWTEHTDAVRPGDRLVLVSDGLLDLVEDPAAWDATLAALVRAAAAPADLLDAVDALEPPGGADITPDDVTVVALFREDA